MTTNVDIIFKELPVMSQATDRISRSDANSIGTDYGRDRSDISRNDKEKSFDEHLEDHKVSSDQHIRNTDNQPKEMPQNQTDENQNEINTAPKEQELSVDDKEKANSNKISVTSDNENPENEVIEETNQENIVKTAVSVENKVDEKVPTYTTKDLLLTETTAEKVALQNNSSTAPSVAKQSANNIVDPVSIQKPSSENTSDQSFEQQSGQNSSSNNMANTTRVTDGELENKTAPDWNAEKNNPANNQGLNTSSSLEAKSSINNSDSQSDTEGRNISIDTSVQPSEKNISVENNNVNKLVSDPEENSTSTAVPNGIALQSQGSKIEPEIPSNQKKNLNLPLNEDDISEEIGKSLSSLAKNLNQEISNADLLSEPAPKTETVSVESNKTLPFAVIQNPNGVQNKSSSGNNKKNGSTISAASNSNKTASLNNGAAANAQSSIASSILQSSQKSDIQIDIGLNGQRFDAPMGQTLLPNGSSALSTGNMLAAQDVGFQKTLSAVSAAKADVQMNAKMINEQITIAINKNVVKGLNNFSIRLHPAELGQVDIKLEFAADGKMHAAMMVESEKTLTMLQRDQASLEKALQDAGINLSNKDMNFSLMKQKQENNANQFAGNNKASQINSEIDELTELGSMQEIRMAYSNQTIDISI